MKHTNLSNLPLPLAIWLADDTYGGKNIIRSKQISVTTLLQPTKQIVLGLHAPEMITDVLSMVASKKGTAVHDAVEGALKSGRFKKAMHKLGYSEDDVERTVVNPTPEFLKDNPNTNAIYSEIRINKQVGDWIVSGEFDLIYEGQVIDIKNTKVYSYTKGNNDDKYIKQGSMYRWLNPAIVTKDKMAIAFVFDDWVEAQAEISSSYPQQQVLTKEYDLMSYGATEMFIRSKLNEIEKYMDLSLDVLQIALPPCTDEDLWRTPSEFKYYSKPDSPRATKAGFTTLGEALMYMNTEKKGVGVVKEIKGQVKRCNYCKAFPVCQQKNTYLAEGSLILRTGLTP